MTTAKANPLTIALQDGSAEYMGDGRFVVLQRDDDLRKMQNVALTEGDLGTLETSTAISTSLAEGVAHYMGDGLWTVLQRDEVAPEQQSVVLRRQEASAMLNAISVAA